MHENVEQLLQFVRVSGWLLPWCYWLLVTFYTQVSNLSVGSLLYVVNVCMTVRDLINFIKGSLSVFGV